PDPPKPEHLIGQTLEKALAECEQETPCQVEELLSVGTTFMLSGDGDSGKSVISANAAAAMSAGLPVWGRFQCKRPLKVLYLMGERSAKETLLRLKRMRDCMPFEVDNLAINDRLIGQIDFTKDEWVDKFMRMVELTLAFLDVLLLERIYTMVPVWDERHVLKLVRSLARLKDALGILVWLTHHKTKTHVD